MPEPGPDDIEPVAHETLDRFATGTVSVVPFLALGVVVLAGVGLAAALERHRGLRDPLHPHRVGRDGRLPSPLHPPLVRHQELAARRVRRVRLGGDRGAGHLLGGRPSQAPRLLRPARRSAQPARRSRRGLARRAARPGPRAHGLALPAHPARRAQALRAGPDRRSGRELRRSHLPLLGDRRPRRRIRPGLADRRDADRRADRPAVGRRRAAARPAPRHLLDQLAVPLLRAPALRHRRRVAQPRVAVAAVLRRGVAQQPPRVPDLRRPRDAMVGVRLVERSSSAASRRPASRGTSYKSIQPASRRSCWPRPSEPWPSQRPLPCAARSPKRFPSAPSPSPSGTAASCRPPPPGPRITVRSPRAVAHALYAAGPAGHRPGLRLGRARGRRPRQHDRGAAALEAAVARSRHQGPPGAGRGARHGPRAPAGAPAVRARARGAPALDRARPPLGAPPLRPAGRVLRALPRRLDDL